MTRYALLLAAAIAVMGAVAFTPAQAKASFKVCNEYKEHINSAVAYYSSEYDYFISEGWWSLDPGQCKTAIAGDLKVKYVYVYAVNDGDSWHWPGDYKMCVNPNDPFTLYNAQNKCPFVYKDFREVDTGDYKSYTYTFK
ncbi:MAG TPA: DUF1036 domain-containing protein [Candidatus Eremiobacteraceae bacterium]|jgi:uncharacterized membrane protein|nr:DUF1036 domain-containing protein [Candidatus Eremiobacteraceae bacterium]